MIPVRLSDITQQGLFVTIVCNQAMQAIQMCHKLSVLYAYAYSFKKMTMGCYMCNPLVN